MVYLKKNSDRYEAIPRENGTAVSAYHYKGKIVVTVTPVEHLHGSLLWAVTQALYVEALPMPRRNDKKVEAFMEALDGSVPKIVAAFERGDEAECRVLCSGPAVAA